MRKKKLLSEAQVKRFMGLAGLKPLNEMYHGDDMSNEGMHEEDLMEADDEDMDEGGDADVEIEQSDLEEIKSALDTLGEKLAPLLDQAGEAPEMDDLDDEGGEELDMGDEEEAPDMDMDDELGDVDVEPSPEEEEAMQEQIVNEVARRVAKRIVEAKRAHQKMNEALGNKTKTRRRKLTENKKIFSGSGMPKDAKIDVLLQGINLPWRIQLDTRQETGARAANEDYNHPTIEKLIVKSMLSGGRLMGFDDISYYPDEHFDRDVTKLRGKAGMYKD